MLCGENGLTEIESARLGEHAALCTEIPPRRVDKQRLQTQSESLSFTSLSIGGVNDLPDNVCNARSITSFIEKDVQNIYV